MWPTLIYSYFRSTGSIKTNLTEVRLLGEEWGSQTLIDIAKSLGENTTHANIGSLNGNRMFYANDYMVCTQIICHDVAIDFDIL